MGDGRAASGLDRLPWLADDNELPPRRSARDFAGIAFVAALGVAAASYWIGLRHQTGFGRFDGSPAHRSTLALPEAREVQPDVAPMSEEPRISPVPQPPIPTISRPTVVSLPPAARTKAPPKPSEPVPAPKSVSNEPSYTKTPWPVRAVEGSSGRLVRVGTFETRLQAKRGWRQLMRNNPSLQRLPALVVAAPSARDGKTYYRLQMGTTSQAHSAILCQRMRMIGQSCVIVADEASGA
jgi:hypothetical protein